MQNWNDGKVQEFKDRKVYHIEPQTIQTIDETEKAETKGEKENQKTDAPVDKLVLVTTRTCPNCHQVEALLQKQGILYEKMLAEEHPKLMEEYGVRQAPTLLIEEETSKPKLIAGVGPIQRFMTEYKVRKVC